MMAYANFTSNHRHAVIAGGAVSAIAGLSVAMLAVSRYATIETCHEIVWGIFGKVAKWYKYMKRSRRAHRIILIRHGESEGNVDSSIYETVPDCNLQLTSKGREQAREAGIQLGRLIGDELTCFYISPYMRAQQTLTIMLQATNFDSKKIMVRLEPRLREQDFGNLQCQHSMKGYKEEREKVGTFWFRFREGESGADVYDRVTLFMETLFRELHDWTRPRWRNVVLVCHGLTMRLFIMRYMNWSVDDFCRVWNPPNCAIVVLEKCPITNGYVLVSDFEYGDDRESLPHHMRHENQWNFDHGKICTEMTNPDDC